MNKAKYITELTSEEVLDFFLQSNQYHNFELPEYFDFSEILNFVRETVGDKPYAECIGEKSAADFSDVNFDILLNKDGYYAVRPLVLCNPYLYYFLAREICCSGNWEKIKDNFIKCTVPHIKSCAIPVVPEKVEKFHMSTTILNWWNTMEQRSIELSLDYRYMFVSDITNCYGTVNPQTIEWALSRRGTSIPTSENTEIANNIIQLLKDFSQGRNIGIPQGSTLFDLIGEIILGYSDLLLSETLKKENILDGYEIIRYRDDYRIFCNDKDKLERISYILQQVLESLNFRMNSTKTFISDSIISDSIKPDKLFYIFNTPIFNKKGCDFDGLQKHLLYIMMFARKYPNSGQIRTMLSDFDKRIIEKLEPHKEDDKSLNLLKEEDTEIEDVSCSSEENHFTRSIFDILLNEEIETQGKLIENVKAMCAICTQIAIENVSVIHYALRIISRMADSVKDDELHDEIISKVCKKFINQPNSTYSKIWLQNMTYTNDVKNKVSPYNVRLCKIVMGEDVVIWNNSWLKKELVDSFPQNSVINSKVLSNVTPIITFRETRAYMDAIENKNVNIDLFKSLIQNRF